MSSVGGLYVFFFYKLIVLTFANNMILNLYEQKRNLINLSYIAIMIKTNIIIIISLRMIFNLCYSQNVNVINFYQCHIFVHF